MTTARTQSTFIVCSVLVVLSGTKGWSQEPLGDLLPPVARPERKAIAPCTVTLPKGDDPAQWQRFARRELSACEGRCLARAIDALRDPWNFESSLAAISLGHLGHQYATEALWEAASNRFRDTETRIWSIEALAGIAHAEAVPRLIQLLDDPRVAVDCLRELLLLAKNPLHLDEQEVLALCKLFYNYEPPPAGDGGYSIEDRSAGYPGDGHAIKDHSPLGILRSHVGGYRSMLGRSNYTRLARGAEFYDFSPSVAWRTRNQ